MREATAVSKRMSGVCLYERGPTKFLYVLIPAQLGRDALHLGGETEDLSTATVTVCSAARILTIS